ncbi:MAG: energy transducer TonB [Armatimonadetes bacterium]|nr:energy transducer TonB [Armatimonadota bacterium]
MVRQVKPRLPEDLRNAEFRASVRVRVEVSENGAPTPSLRGSSGNAAVDELVLDVLRRWKWKPALRHGEPVSSTQNFRFDFEVR